MSYSSVNAMYITSGSSYSTASSLYAIEAPKASCCGRFASGNRCGSCPNK